MWVLFAVIVAGSMSGIAVHDIQTGNPLAGFWVGVAVVAILLALFAIGEELADRINSKQKQPTN